MCQKAFFIKDFFTVSFDESLNKIAQKAQMDIVIRYFEESKNIVVTKYYNSRFLYRASADNLIF